MNFVKSLCCIMQLKRSTHIRGHEAATLFLAFAKKIGVTETNLFPRHVAWNSAGLYSSVMKQAQNTWPQFSMSHWSYCMYCFCKLPPLQYIFMHQCAPCTSLLPMLTQTRRGLSPPYVLATCLLVCADLVSIWSLYGRLPNWKKYPEGPGSNNAKIATVTTAERFLQGCRLYLWISHFFRSTGV